ncbi:hypothetical protein NitYY0814_C1179 [Nitratiruptor sp. YY08-14]|nr:hypothetical protein NitYY0814_C1179 [Nitratiruptor sp. YY08-14]
MGVGRQEALYESTFGENSSKEIWQFESDKKDIAVYVRTQNGSG